MNNIEISEIINKIETILNKKNDKELVQAFSDIIIQLKKVENNHHNENISNEYFSQFIFNNIDLAIRIIDTRFLVRAANEQYHQLHPSLTKSIINKKCYDFICSEDCYTEQCSLKQILKGKRRLQKDVRIITEKGTKDYIMTVEPFYNQNGEIEGIIETFKNITERKQSELALMKSETKFKQLFNTINEAVYLHKLTGNPAEEIFIEVNERAIQMLEYSREELLQKSPGDITVKRTPENIREIVNKSLKNNFTFEAIQKAKSGKEIPVEINAYIYELDEEKYVLSAVRDITDRKRKERAIRESEERYKGLFHSNHTIMLLINSETKIIEDANKTACKFYGYTLREIKQKKINQICLNIKDRAYHFIAKHKLANGVIKHVEVYEGQININEEQYFHWIVHDIQERLMAERELKKMQVAVQQSPASIVITSKTGHIVYVNPKFEEVTGYLLDEAKGKNPRILKSGKTPENTYPVLWSTILSGKVWHGNFINRKKNGEEYREKAIISPIFDHEKRIVNFIAVKEDVTLQWEAEKMIKKQNKELQESNATKDKLFSIISHDLRSPFNTLLGFSELLMKNYKKYTDEKLERFITLINKTANNTYDLLENLLYWSRAQSNRIPFNPHKVQIKSIALAAVLLHQETAKQKKVKIINNIDESIYSYADEQMLKTVYRNLISNAIKFSNPNGEIILLCKILKNLMIECSVQDNGVGIAEKDLNKLFKRDESYSTQGTNNERGTGIGLLLCKDFIEINGGEIRVESRVGEGSTFYFTLPPVFVRRNKDEEDIIIKFSIIKSAIIKNDKISEVFIKEIIPNFRYTFKNLSKNQLESFIELLNHFKNNYKINELNEFSKRLTKSSANYDINNINICMNYFEKLIDSIEKEII